jgi:hypothetical protein
MDLLGAGCAEDVWLSADEAGREGMKQAPVLFSVAVTDTGRASRFS